MKGLRGRVDLGKCPVDDEEGGAVSESGVVLAHVFQIAFEAPADHVVHRRGVIPGGVPGHRKPFVVLLFGQAVFEYHQRAHHVLACRVGVVDAFDA